MIVRMENLRITALTVVLSTGIFLISCKNTEKDNGPTNQKPGTITGKITNADGTPIAGANVVVDNTLFYNSNILTTTNNEGKYEAQLPVVGTYVTTATIVKQLNGKSYTLDLHPEHTEALSNEGGVRNFSFRLTGKKPEGSSSYYGGTVSINSVLGSEIGDPENIEFTLVPVGNLIDGSAGSTLKIKAGAPYTAEYGYLVDIPLGRYNMQATYMKDNTKVSLKLRKHFDSSSVFSTTFQLDFEPETSIGRNMAIIEYAE
jgi:hypothetical protein